MVNERDILALQLRLERARALLLAGHLGEDAVWRLLKKVERVLDRDQGSAYRPTLMIIYSLTETLWSSTRQQQELKRIKALLS